MVEDDQDTGMDQVDEEYSVWKKNSPFLYDLVISHPLEWPSLTVHWSPSSPRPHATDPFLAVHNLVLGTHTSEGFSNFLMVADVLIPIKIKETVSNVNDPNTIIPKAEITQKIRVDGEVNKARYMPQKANVVGAKTSGTEVVVFDCTKHEAKLQGGEFDPDLRLRGHDKEGYGLSWNPGKEGYLLSGSHDCKICLWDVSAVAEDKVLDPLHVYKGHESVVGDVSWHLKDGNLFGSVGDDCKLIIWDLRTDQSQHSVKAHEKEVNYLSFDPFNEWILATASSDATVGLFDMRRIALPLHVLSSHTKEVFQVEWDPNHEAVLASSAYDRRLMIWDLNRIGDEQLEGDADDGPPELLFSHGGHIAKISDFSWNKYEPWVISSVADDNTLQVWQLADSIYGDAIDGIHKMNSALPLQEHSHEEEVADIVALVFKSIFKQGNYPTCWAVSVITWAQIMCTLTFGGVKDFDVDMYKFSPQEVIDKHMDDSHNIFLAIKHILLKGVPYLESWPYTGMKETTGKLDHLRASESRVYPLRSDFQFSTVKRTKGKMNMCYCPTLDKYVSKDLALAKAADFLLTENPIIMSVPVGLFFKNMGRCWDVVTKESEVHYETADEEVDTIKVIIAADDSLRKSKGQSPKKRKFWNVIQWNEITLHAMTAFGLGVDGDESFWLFGNNYSDNCSGVNGFCRISMSTEYMFRRCSLPTFNPTLKEN